MAGINIYFYALLGPDSIGSADPPPPQNKTPVVKFFQILSKKFFLSGSGFANTWIWNTVFTGYCESLIAIYWNRNLPDTGCFSSQPET
jgi:hypothetical protein